MGVRVSQRQLAELIGEDPGAVAEASPRPHRVAAGRRAAKSGRSLERDLGDVHKAYRAAGVAALDNLNMATAPYVLPQAVHALAKRAGTRTPGMLRRIVGRAPYDFGGTLGPALGSRWCGRSVIVEAKNTTNPAASMAISEAGVSMVQLVELVERWERWGAVSVLVWRNGDQVGVLGPAELVAVLAEAQEAGGKGRIRRDRFRWLTGCRQFGALDYLGAVLEAL